MRSNLLSLSGRSVHTLNTFSDERRNVCLDLSRGSELEFVAGEDLYRHIYPSMVHDDPPELGIWVFGGSGGGMSVELVPFQVS